MAEQGRQREERWEAIQIGTLTTPMTDRGVARLNAIQHFGQIDRKLDGPGYRLYHGPVGDESMDAQITEYQGEICVCFWGADSRARRLLVTERGDLWLEVWAKCGVKTIRHSGKYAVAWTQMAAVRTPRRKEAACG